MPAPPPVPALPDTERRVAYTLSASTGPMAVTFALYGDGTDYQNWVQVWGLGGGVNIPYNDLTSGWTLTSPTGPLGSIPRPITDATISFNSPQSGTFEIIGARRPRRLNQFTETQGVAARDLNQVITDITADNREFWDYASTRTLYVPGGETVTVIPPAGVRANQLLGFDGSGNPHLYASQFILFAAPPVTYYISAAGSDSNNGTSQSTPWQTIAKVNSIAAAPGSSFLFRSGDTFTGTITVAASGLRGLPITYGTYNDNNTGGVAQGPSGIVIGQATISSPVNQQGFVCTAQSFITVRNLIFQGAGYQTGTPLTNGTNGMYYNGLAGTVSQSGFVIDNVTVTQYFGDGIAFWVGDAANHVSNPIIWSDISITNCLVYNVGGSGIHFNTHGGAQQTATLPYFQAHNNVLVDHCHIHDIQGTWSNQSYPGAGPSGARTFNAGGGIIAQGIDNLTIQYCVIHDTGLLIGIAGYKPFPGMYFGDVANAIIQNNECYNIACPGAGSTSGSDCQGMLFDFDVTNTIIQYNYLHECLSNGLQVQAQNISGQPNSSFNIVVRYNIIANNGTGQGFGTDGFDSGLGVNCLSAAPCGLTNTLIHNNTVVVRGSIVSPVMDMSSTNAGAKFGVIFANNLFVGDGVTPMLNYYEGGGAGSYTRFLANDYVGGNFNTAGTAPDITGFVTLAGGTRYNSLSAWLATQTAQEVIDGAAAPYLNNVDPLFCAQNLPPASLPGNAANFKISAMSPVANAGLPINKLLNMQAVYRSISDGLTPMTVDMDFKGQKYQGDVIGSISCSRASALATDLMPWDPIGRGVSGNYNTFGANTLRITAGKGLLIEGAGTRTQELTSPTAPATQTTGSLGTGSYILWMSGTGSVMANGGTATYNKGVASHGQPWMLDVTVAGTVTITKFGSVDAFQLESDPLVSRIPTSLISAAGTRDPDIVSCTTASTIGQVFRDFLTGNGAAHGNQWGTTEFWFHGVNPVPSSVLVTDSVNAAQCQLNSLIVQGNNPRGYVGYGMPVFGQSLINSVTLTTANQITQTGPYRGALAYTPSNAIAFRWDATGQFITLNGGTVASNSNPQTVAAQTTFYIGADSTGASCINGYMERIRGNVSVFTTNPISTAQMQTDTSITQVGYPISALYGKDAYGATVPGFAGLATQDFFGNPVPNRRGNWSIGAHQPSEDMQGGGTVTLNGATPVTVTNANVQRNSNIIFTLKTVGGTVGAVPSIKTITSGTGFTVAGTAADTSTYNYVIFG